MSEDLNQEVVNEIVDTPELHEDADISGVEQKALDLGWRPKDEFDGDPDKWIEAGEFLRRQPLFDKIESQSKEIKEVRKALKSLQEHADLIRQTEYKRAIADLRAEKKQALEDGDADRLIEIDEELAEIKANEKVAQLEQSQTAKQPDPRFVSWVGQNSWYLQDPELRAFADEVGTIYSKSNPDIDPEDVLAYVTKRVQKAYPENFKNERRSRPNSVESGTTPVTKKKDTFELSEEERRVMKRFVRTGVMSEEQYIADLKKAKGAI